MQSVALVWLVLQLGGRGIELGLVVALQFLPMMLFGVWGGIYVDRLDKRRILLVTQSSAALIAVALGILSATGVVQLWSVFTMSFLLGCVTVLDNPTRQSFVMEMVGPEDVSNAVGLNSSVITLARVAGPALAGIIIASVGVTLCFFLNAASYLAVLVALVAMDPSQLRSSKRAGKAKGQLREGLQYVWKTPQLKRPLLLLVVVGTLAYNFNTLLPLMTRFVYNGDAKTLGVLSALLGVGAMGGALITASRSRPTNRLLLVSSLLFGAFVVALAMMPNLTTEMIVIVPTGFFSILFVSTVNATLQMTASDEMRGRVMALYAVVFLGSTPIGGPLVGWIAEASGPRVAFALGGVATVIAASIAIAPHLRERMMVGLRPLAREAIDAQHARDGSAAELAPLRMVLVEARERVTHAARSLPGLRTSNRPSASRRTTSAERVKSGRRP
jgi:MFS family permease